MNERRKSLLVPVILLICFVVFFMLWLLGFSYLFSVGDMRFDKGDIFADMVWPVHVEVGVWLFVFAFLWYSSFIISSNIFIIACLCVGWYFYRDDPGMEKGMFTYFYWAWFIHAGSLAFGSFLIALLWLLALLTKYLYKKLKESGMNNQQFGFLFKCLLCCIGCFE